MKNAALRDLSIDGLTDAYRRGDFTPRQLLEQLLRDCAGSDNPVWIQRLSAAQLEPYLAALEGRGPDQLPLYGVPFAIKDNIDLAGIATTAACPDFAYTPAESAAVVQRLVAAGAIPLGKTNLDQFATGLVGVRSPQPWGPCRNAIDERYIAGGSSSGSAVAVARGWVSFALGTDTAGSGRVPAALNNIVGLKPSCGLISTTGVVPACRSLDTVSIFASSCEDANRVFDQAVAFDAADPYSRPNTYANGRRYFGRWRGGFDFAVPQPGQLRFFGDASARRQFELALAALQQIGGRRVEVDFAPFLEAARLLYEGPCVAERYLATQALLERKPEALLPVLRSIIGAGRDYSAADAYRAAYRLRACAQRAAAILARVDIAVTPTVGRAYTVEAVLADPIELNSNLGYYTNFVNLLDCAAVALPTGKLDSGIGFGVTLLQRAFSDKRLLSLAARLQQHLRLPPGAAGAAYREYGDSGSLSCSLPYACVEVVVCGAHMRDLPLNWQLRERGGEFVRTARTLAEYRLYALPGGPPARPGLVREPGRGAAIEVEIWRLPAYTFGSFVNEIPAPLGIGKIQLADGGSHSGFICEPCGLEGAKDITGFGGWRKYLGSSSC